MSDQKEKVIPKKIQYTNIVIACVFLFLFLFFILNPIVIIHAGQKGLVMQFGAIQDKILDQGLHFRVPIMDKIKTISIQPMQIDYTIPVTEAGAITKDNQTIGVDTSVFYSYDEGQLVTMWQNYGIDNIKNLIQTATKESFKEVVGDYTIFDVAQKQEEIRGKVWENLVAKMSAYPVRMKELRVSNYDWSDAFDAQIQETMTKAQQVKQKEQELLITEQEAQKLVKQAEAEKQATVTKAEGARDAAKLQAEAKALEGEGIKQYNEKIAANLDVQIKLKQLDIEMTKWSKWNGQQVPAQNFTAIPLDWKGVTP